MTKELLEKLWNAIKQTKLSSTERKKIFEQFQSTFDALDEDTLKKLDAEAIFNILLDQMKNSGVKTTDIESFKKAYKAEAKPEVKAEAKPEAPPESIGDMDQRVIAAEAAEIEAAQKGQPIVPETRGPKINKHHEQILRNIIADIRAQGGKGNPKIAASVIANLPPDIQKIWEKCK